MKIELWTFGKEHKDYIEKGVQLYSERIKKYAPFEIKILSAGKKSGKLDPQKLKAREGEVVLDLLHAKDTLITLDEKGKAVSSVELAKVLETRQLAADKKLIFLIGGAYGITDVVLKKSQKVFSLSALTFPHQLVLLIMTEQIYRAFSILHHQPYHHL